MPALWTRVTLSAVMLLCCCVTTPGPHIINLRPFVMWMTSIKGLKRKTESLTDACYLPRYSADFCTHQMVSGQNKDLQSAFTWNLFPQNVLVQSNKNICITVRQFPQPPVYVTLAEEVICHICPVCGKQMVKWVHQARQESCSQQPPSTAGEGGNRRSVGIINSKMLVTNNKG